MVVEEHGPRHGRAFTRVLLLAVLVLAGAAALSACGSAATAGTSRLLDGGVTAYESKLWDLRGRPIVVNQWASWCGPCRTEFPIFREQAAKREGQVAFLGVDAMDVRGAAAAFLDEQPTGYPHFFDKQAKVARTFGGGRVWPTTAFYDAQGKVVYARQGAYSDEQDLARDIDRYLLGG